MFRHGWEGPVAIWTVTFSSADMLTEADKHRLNSAVAAALAEVLSQLADEGTEAVNQLDEQAEDDNQPLRLDAYR